MVVNIPAPWSIWVLKWGFLSEHDMLPFGKHTKKLLKIAIEIVDITH